MKLAVAVLALVAAAYAQTLVVTVQNGFLGYDNDCNDVAPGTGSCYANWQIPASMQPNSTSTVGYVVIGINSKNINTNGALIEVSGRAYKGSAPLQPSQWGIQDEIILRKAVADGDKIIYGSIPFAYGNGSWPDGVAVWASVKSCSTCSRSADFKLTAFFARGTQGDCHPSSSGTNTPPNLDLCILQPYMIKDNSFTWDYELAQNSYGVAAYTSGPTPAADFQLYTAVDVQGTGSASISLVYSKNAPYSPARTNGQLPATPPTDVYVIPRGTTRSGDYRTGGLALSMGTWYVQPFVNNAGTGGGKAPFDLAFGINHEPSAAGIAVPSLLIAAILSIAALLL